MAEILMTKTISGQLAPMDDFAVQKIAALKVGQAVKITYKRVRNPRFHRKAFALFNLACRDPHGSRELKPFIVIINVNI